MATTTTIVRATGQVEWTGPTPTILDGSGNNLVGAIYNSIEQPTPAGAWGDESADSWVEFEVSATTPVEFGCAPIPAPATALPLSRLEEVRVVCTIAHSDISAVTTYHPILFDSRVPSIGWDDTTLMLTASGVDTSGVPGTYPAPPVTAYAPSSTDPTRLAAMANLVNSGYAYFGFSYGSPSVSAVSTCRVFEAWVEFIYTQARPPQLRKYPNPNIGPARQWPRPRRGITGIR